MSGIGHVSLHMMACGFIESFHGGNGVPQNVKGSFSEFNVARHLYKKIVTNGDVLSLLDLLRSLTPAERCIFGGKEVRLKSLRMFLNKHHHIFQISRDSVKGRELVRPVIDIEFCKVFDSKQGCSDLSCPKLHVCRHFVKGKCTFGVKCKKPHHFEDPHTLLILQKHYLDTLDHSQLKEFLCRNVQFALDDSVTEACLPKQLEICKYYNVAIGCSREGLCPFLHVCRFYAEDGTCKFGQKCIRKHDCRNDHARKLLLRYDIKEHDVFSHLRKQRKTVKQGFLPNDTLTDFERLRAQIKSPKYRGRTVSLDGYDALSTDQILPRKISEPNDLSRLGNTYVCAKYLEGRCKLNNCDRVHALMPYCWQYTVNNRSWKDVSNEENLKIEAVFVDACKDHVIFNIEDNRKVVLNFKESIGFLSLPSPSPLREQASVAIPIRRLSTPSSVTVTEENVEFTTQWVWYYLDDFNKWQMYDDTANIKIEISRKVDSLQIEMAYQSIGQENFMFNCDGVTFVIDFKSMTQENRNTRQRRQVKRRPKVFDFDKLYKRRKVDTELEISFFPSYWKTDELHGISGGDFGQYELLELEPYSREYLKVFDDFGKTMGYENVFKIGAVQNIGLWMAYTMERDTMKEEDPKMAGEITLFCAVLWEDAKKICRYGFENDMVSAGNTCYYLAKDAVLANACSRPNDAGIFVTFRCRVLANSCSPITKFKPHLEKFLNSKHHSLFDENGHETCNQSIYHVAEGRHIYPEFIILSRHAQRGKSSIELAN